MPPSPIERVGRPSTDTVAPVAAAVGPLAPVAARGAASKPAPGEEPLAPADPIRPRSGSLALASRGAGRCRSRRSAPDRCAGGADDRATPLPRSTPRGPAPLTPRRPAAPSSAKARRGADGLHSLWRGPTDPRRARRAVGGTAAGAAVAACATGAATTGLVGRSARGSDHGPTGRPDQGHATERDRDLCGRHPRERATATGGGRAAAGSRRTAAAASPQEQPELSERTGRRERRETAADTLQFTPVGVAGVALAAVSAARPLIRTPRSAAASSSSRISMQACRAPADIDQPRAGTEQQRLDRRDRETQSATSSS